MISACTKVITFGSCLSRYTANHYIKLFGGELISSVYHNRSDAFVNRFIENKWGDVEYERILRAMADNSGTADEDNKSRNILKNQSRSEIGKHRLKSGLDLFLALDSSPDLILVDNYMDLSAKLAYEKSNGEGVLFKLGELRASQKDKFELGSHLDPIEAVSYMHKVIDYFKDKAPEANIVFINFPHDTYQDLGRAQRTELYEKEFSREDCVVIGLQKIHKTYRTDEKQHFKPPQYAAYAGMVRALIN